MPRRFVFLFALLLTPVALAQFDSPEAQPKTRLKARNAPQDPDDPDLAEKIAARGVQLGTAETQQWRCGVQVRAFGGPCAGIFGTIAVPTDWPEQSVKVTREEITPNVRKVDFRTVDQGVRQLILGIPQLANGETAKAIIILEVERHALLPPPDTSIFVLPIKPPVAVKKHLGISPLIESTQLKIKNAAEEMVAGKTTAWETVEALYDGVRERVKWQNDSEKGALAALEDGQADKEDLTGLFVALCRAQKIPARLVWIPDSLYAEFYLEDEEANGYWIPCYVASEKKEFGFVSTHAPILQKGDNIKVPEKKESQRFVAEFLTGKGGGGRPQVEFIRRLEEIMK